MDERTAAMVVQAWWRGVTDRARLQDVRAEYIQIVRCLDGNEVAEAVEWSPTGLPVFPSSSWRCVDHTVTTHDATAETPHATNTSRTVQPVATIHLSPVTPATDLAAQVHDNHHVGDADVARSEHHHDPRVQSADAPASPDAPDILHHSAALGNATSSTPAEQPPHQPSHRVDMESDAAGTGPGAIEGGGAHLDRMDRATLLAYRAELTLELAWMQQAIASREKYLVLKRELLFDG
eukprot:m.215639 g.215639  ORF g.215639 m.215639 type:complete len:236 (-) comp27979_c0_seq1:140-847(-)